MTVKAALIDKTMHQASAWFHGLVSTDSHALLVRDASGGIFPTNTHTLTLAK